MCGRFVQTSSPADIEFSFRTTNPLPNVQPRYNAAPGQDLMAVRRHPDTGQRSLDLLRWGLIPHWAKEAKIGWNHINARAESIDKRPAFRFAYRKRRCLVPVDGFYEWKQDGTRKQPFAIALKGRELFAFAGLWENWQDPETEQWVRTFTIITTDANELVAPIHDRMPVIVGPEDFERWLMPETDAKDLLRPYPAELMTAWPISTRVNSPRNEGAELLEAIEA